MAAQKKIALETYSYVSLFGVTSLDQLKYSVFGNRTSGDAIATGANMETFGRGIDTAVRTFGIKALEALAGKTATDLVQSGAFLMVRDQIVCSLSSESRSSNAASHAARSGIRILPARASLRYSSLRFFGCSIKS